MMVGDVVAVYGAVVATGLAILQFYQWKQHKRIFSISLYDELARPPSHIEATITNLTNQKIYVQAVWFGYSYFKWSAPYKRVLFGGFGMFKTDGEFLSKKQFDDFVAAGQPFEVWAGERVYAQLGDPPSLTKGFRPKLTIAVQHSLSEDYEMRVLH